MTALLYHYTCRHQVAALRAAKTIRPAIQLHGQNICGAQFAWFTAWFTDLAPPVPREAVGLTSLILDCDRTEFVFTVDRNTPGIRRWVDVRRNHRELWDLERANGALPMHWFVSERPVPVLRELTAIGTAS